MKQCDIITIGLTGGIATGKSTVSKILLEKGFRVIDADKIAKDVVNKGQEAYYKIVDYFGQEILLENEGINRAKLGRIIFNDKTSREELNKIVHPYVFSEIKKQIEIISKDNSIIFLDIPLLFEQYDMWEKYSIKFSEIWLVYCEKNIQVTRLMDRDNISKKEALAKINSQMDLIEKRKMASKTINNSKDKNYLEKQIDELLKKI